MSLQKSANYFPLGIAKGKAFCNRVDERARLKNNLDRGIHSLLVSPRRYGKSSLVQFTLGELKIPYVKVDFFIAVDETVIEKEIVQQANALINAIGKKHETLILKLKELVKNLSLKLTLGTDGVNVEVSPSNKMDPARNIFSVLTLLEEFLRSKKAPAVFFIDEFQEIAVEAASKGIEGAIRSVAQETEYLKFVFSGSNRHLLSQMFEDRSRPLYKLCDKITLDRIHKTSYKTFLNNYANKTWNKPLKDIVLDQLFQKTERHPYYMNLLCGRVWQEFVNNPPSNEKAIDTIWNVLIDESRNEAYKDLSALSNLQLKTLIEIASGNNKHLQGKQTYQKLNVSPSAMKKSVTSLLLKDYIYLNEEKRYCVIDPIIKAIILNEYDGGL